MNPATGDGGTCYGDSGGPNFLGTSTTIAAITITGDAVCRATNVVYRLDTESARNFLREFVRLPWGRGAPVAGPPARPQARMDQPATAP